MFLTAVLLATCEPGPATAQPSCIVDGDTFRWEGERIRIADIDAPETDQAKCPAERERGEQAKQRLLELLNGGDMHIVRSGVDRYRRTLATVTVNGRSVGEQLISEGLARPWAGRRMPWCP